MSAILPPNSSGNFHTVPTADFVVAMQQSDVGIVVVKQEAIIKLLKQFQYSPKLLSEYKRLTAAGPISVLRLGPNNSMGTLICLLTNHITSPHAKLTQAAKAWREASALKPKKVLLSVFELDDELAWLEALSAAVLAGSAPLPQLKSKPEKPVIPDLTLATNRPTTAFAVSRATHAGNHLARWLTAQPPNVLHAGSYRRALEALAKQHGWQHEFMDMKRLAKLKAGAFLAVARGNAHAQAGIVHLRYRSKSRTTKRARGHTLCLVGKGICFDTGGINLKSHKGMFDMHTDMQGSAVAVGTLLALSMLKVPYDIDCWLALSENEIGPNAYRPQEVVTAANGTTIQVVHSDAEGRMVLADTLALATRSKPSLLIDFATLTGACVAALTERMSGAFSNHSTLRSAIEQAGHDSGERVWCFPMYDDFDSDLDSQIADIMQCTMDNKGDHILAARFLNRFVPASVPWIHLDLSAASRTGGLGHVPTEITGFGVRWAVQFMQQHSFNNSTP